MRSILGFSEQNVMENIKYYTISISPIQFQYPLFPPLINKIQHSLNIHRTEDLIKTH